MKVSLSWLKEHLDTDAPFEAIVTQLNALGLVVDGIHNPATALNAFIIAEIVEATQHPNADRLRVCRVNTGQEVLQVVCGAPNARTGLKGVFAPVGTTIPANGMVLKPTKIRDVESAGMLCSYAELNLEGGHEGIIELPSDAPVGQRYAVYAGLDDPVLDIDVTPNRGDCLAVRGIARDLAATGMGTLKMQSLQSIQASFPSPINVAIDLPAEWASACRHFTGRVIRGVKNRPSPEWLQKKLNAVGLRSISALVDITNLMAYDWARPMHVFDADKIQGDLVVRLARKGEKLKALDDKEYTLDETMTVVADATGPLSIAGIMGGADSGCSDETTNVFLESAYFGRINTAQTGRKLSIHSDSRARFERGVDPALVVLGLERATQLILDLCGGEASEVVIAGSSLDAASWRIRGTARRN
jgi:phenylalanyl-tRNA synthetase beta chain